jgi:16S rRNA (guanine966-N2)-methyltransferase
MRIIAGRFKGRGLSGPAGPGVRPTSDSLRETLFNILSGAVTDARVLDGFAGTGALGLEALSRGAAHVTFIESDRRALQVLRDNIRRCAAEDATTVVARDFFRACREPRNPGTSEPRNFDLILLDPPYDVEDLDAVAAAAAPLVAPDGWLVLEHSRRREAPMTAASLGRTRVVVAGDSALAFYRWSPPSGSPSALARSTR